MTIVTVVLASGRGTRLGGPKALLCWPCEGGDRPLAAAHASARLAAESERVVVVTRADLAQRLAPHLEGGTELLVSDAPDAWGPAGSIAVAARSGLLAAADLVLLTPVDVPPARAQTVAALVDALSQPGAEAARPMLGRRRGHPVLVRARVLDGYLAGEPSPLRDALRALGARVVDVEVDDPTTVFDIDTPEDALAWAAQAGKELPIRFF